MGADSGQGIFTAAEPFHPTAAFPRGNFMTAANVVTTTVNADFLNFPTVSANVDFLQNVQSNFLNFSNAVTRADFAQDVLMDFADIVTTAAGGDFSGDTQRAADVDVAPTIHLPLVSAAQNQGPDIPQALRHYPTPGRYLGGTRSLGPARYA